MAATSAAAAVDSAPLPWKLCYDKDGSIDPQATNQDMYKALMSSNTALTETQLVLLRIGVATVDRNQEHRTSHAALGVAGGAYVEPTVVEQQGWLNVDPLSWTAWLTSRWPLLTTKLGTRLRPRPTWR